MSLNQCVFALKSDSQNNASYYLLKLSLKMLQGLHSSELVPSKAIYSRLIQQSENVSNIYSDLLTIPAHHNHCSTVQ